MNHLMKISFSLKLAAQIVGVLAFASTAKAVSYNIQFARNNNAPIVQSGAAAYGNAGDTWNLCYGNSGTSPLVDSTGASSSVSISWMANGARTTVNEFGQFGFYGTAYANLMRGYLYSSMSGDKPLTISGLSASSTYTTYLYTQGNSSCGGRQMSATTDTGTYTTSAAVESASSFVEGQNYLCFTGNTDAAGTLLITYKLVTGEANVNGLQLVYTSPIPEPTMCGLLVGAASGLLALRRRNSA